jgi:hypothetical protein
MTLKKVIKRKLNIRENISSIFRENIFLPKFIYVEVEREIIKNTFP